MNWCIRGAFWNHGLVYTREVGAWTRLRRFAKATIEAGQGKQASMHCPRSASHELKHHVLRNISIQPFHQNQPTSNLLILGRSTNHTQPSSRIVSLCPKSPLSTRRGHSRASSPRPPTVATLLPHLRSSPPSLLSAAGATHPCLLVLCCPRPRFISASLGHRSEGTAATV
jgi:hypothetical protein